MKLQSNNNLSKQEDEIDLKKIVYQLIGYWYWFIIFGIIGLVGAYAYSHITKRTFSVSSSILIPQKSTEFDMKQLFDFGMEQNYTEIYNQIEILKSSLTIKKTMTKLNWRTSWYKKEIFLWNGFYKKEPFDVFEPPNSINASGIKVYITPKDDNNYRVSASETIENKGIKNKVNFEANGEYGRPFKNRNFNFTLFKKVNSLVSNDEKYYFVFNDLSQTILAYQKRLNASLKDKFSDIVICTIAGTEIENETDFLNELVNVYINQKMEFQNEALSRSLNFIDVQLAGIADSLNISGNKFTAFRSKNDIIDLGNEGTLVMNNLKDIETEKAKSQVQLDYFKNVLFYLEKSGDLTKLVSPSVVGIEDASLNLVVIKLGELYNRRQILSYTAKDNNPTLVMLDNELAQTRKRLNENLRNLIENTNRTINSMNERQSTISAKLNKLPAKEQQMINIQRQYNLTNEIYTFLLQKRAETNIKLASSISDVQVIEIASPETANSTGLTSKMITIIGLLLGLGIPTGIILLINVFETRIFTQEDIENNTQLPIIGNIMHNTYASELTVYSNSTSNIAESFRDLRTNLDFMFTSPQAKVISIHSTNTGEGKSYNSINLATILAMNEHKVLLIGADMRKPKLHKIFNVDNLHGLSTYLIGHDSFEQIIFPTQIENLSILTSGPIPPNPSEILSRPAMKNLIELSRSHFDHIIIDNAPVGMVTDGIIVSRLSELNIFILRFGISQINQLEMINQYAVTQKVTNICLIVNDIKDNSFGKSYFKYSQFEAYKKIYNSSEENEKKANRKKVI